ncbi:MAG: hypothetical protein K1X88_20835 [Nannocystaceae bacterium]|nr:hypothetical protein [Nannocystaceae bacterium]
MPAREPRRRFAAPLVLTIAATPACAGSSTTGAEPPTTAGPTTAEPQPQPQPQPEPGDGTTADDARERRWTVMRNGKTCQTMIAIDCSQPPGQPQHTCNPPAPREYPCPTYDDGSVIDVGPGFTIEGEAGAKDCTMYFPTGDCPADASCNPPPPRRVDCPAG